MYGTEMDREDTEAFSHRFRFMIRVTRWGQISRLQRYNICFSVSYLLCNRRMHFPTSTFLASCSLSLIRHVPSSWGMAGGPHKNIYSIIFRILLGHKSPSVDVSVKHQRILKKKKKRKFVSVQHTKIHSLYFFVLLMAYTFPFSACLSLSPAHELLETRKIPSYTGICGPQLMFGSESLLTKVFTISQHWPWPGCCLKSCGGSSGERREGSGWWVRWLEAVLTGFPDA